jgi:hypothetical protein
MKVHKDVMAPALLIVEQPAGRLKTGPRCLGYWGSVRTVCAAASG